MRRAVGVSLKRDRGDGDDRTRGEPPFEIAEPALPVGEAESPAVVVDHDRDVIRVLERLGTALEGLVIEVPPWRRCVPDQLGELIPVLLVAGPSALGREIELVPPRE